MNLTVSVEFRSYEELDKTMVRAGVFERVSFALLKETGLGQQIERERVVHYGIELRSVRRGHCIDLHELTSERSITETGCV